MIGCPWDDCLPAELFETERYKRWKESQPAPHATAAAPSTDGSESICFQRSPMDTPSALTFASAVLRVSPRTVPMFPHRDSQRGAA